MYALPHHSSAYRLPSPLIALLLVSVLGALLAVDAVPASAEGPGVSTPKLVALSDAEREWIREHPPIRVHNETDWPPFNFAEAGQPRGYSIDFMNLVAQRVGLQVEYVTGPSWDEFLTMMKRDELDVMLNIVRTRERQQYLRFTPAYARNPSILLSRREAHYGRIEQLFDRTVAVPKGFFYEEILRRDFPRIKVLPVRDALATVEAVSRGDADAALGELAVFNYFAASGKAAGMSLSSELNLWDPELSLARMAVGKDQMLLASILSKGIDSVGLDERRAIERKWLGTDKAFDVPWAQAHLSGAELEWLEQHRDIRLGIASDYPPFEFVDEKGEYAGMSADYIALIAKRLGVTMRPVSGLSWSEVIEGVKHNRLDVLPAAAPLPEREAFLNFSARYLIFPVVIIGREGSPLIAGLGDLRGKTVALVADYASTDEIAQQYPDLTILRAKNPLDTLRAVAAGQADATVLNLGTASYLIAQKNLKGLTVAAPAGIEARGLAIGVREDWPELPPILDKVLASITPEEETAIRNKWIVAPYDVRLAAAQTRELMAQVAAAAAIISLAVLLWIAWLKRKMKERQVAEEQVAAKEAELRDMFDRSPVSVVIVSLDGNIRYANTSLVRLLGTSADELLGSSVQELYYDPAERDAIVDSVTSQGSVHDLEVRFKTKSGEPFYMLLSADLYLYQNEKCLVSWLVDINARKQAERALAATERHLRDTANSVPGAVYQLRVAADGQRAYTFMSDGVLGLRGISAEEARRDYTLLWRQVLDEDKPELDQAIREAIASGAPMLDEFRIRRPDGTVRWLQSGAVPQSDPDGTIRLNGYWIDVTLHRETEDALAVAKQEADAANDAKSSFLASMSHEIRTPMNAIIGMAHLALRTELTPRQRDYLTKIRSSGEHLLGIINDILDFSKIEAGKLAVETVDFDFDGVLDTVSTLISEKATAKGLELVFDIRPSIAPSLKGDPLRLGQVLINLCNNAVKFTDHGEVVLRVGVAQDLPDKQLLRFEVSDTGIGLTQEQIGRLFQAFEQADSTTTRQYGGTGLGLAISKRLVELMGGEIGVTSVYGHGSTFWFTAWLDKGTATRARTVLPDMRGRRVLVIDDNEQSRRALADQLASLTFEVDEAETGLAGIELVDLAARSDHPYDIAFVDWQMPEFDGIETGKRIRSLPSGKLPHLVIVTAAGGEEAFAQAREAGFAAVLTKPASPSTLFDTTIGVLGGGHADQSAAKVLPSPPLAAAAALRGLRILLVEDNELNREVALGLLEDAEVSIEIAENGAIAVEKVKARPYDIVLMDMQMPVMDGIEATRRIRSDARFRDLPIIAMTANAMASDREQCLAAGMNDHVAKPIDPAELFRAISRSAKILPADQAATETTVVRKAPETGIPAIAGVDTRTGLSRTGNKPELYITLLRKFTDRHGSNAAEIRSALDAKDMASAQRIAHTLKGVAGTIGAVELSGSAQRLEAALKSGGEVADTIGILADQINDVVASIRQALPEPVRVPSAQPTATPAACIKDLSELRKLLQADDGEAADFINKIAPNLSTIIGDDEVESLSRRIGDFDFPAALTGLDDACRRLSLELE